QPLPGAAAARPAAWSLPTRPSVCALPLRHESTSRLHPEATQRLRRTASPFHYRRIPRSADILDRHLARPEAGGDRIAEKADEGDAVAPSLGSACRPGDVVQQRRALLLTRLHEAPLMTSARLRIHPCEPPAHATGERGVA